jgi:uncharacterized coiled-coil DUF342 family protein
MDDFRAEVRRLRAERDAFRAAFRAVKATVGEWRRDADEHMNRFGQHMPASVECLADQVDAALAAAGVVAA